MNGFGVSAARRRLRALVRHGDESLRRDLLAGLGEGGFEAEERPDPEAVLGAIRRARRAGGSVNVVFTQPEPVGTGAGDGLAFRIHEVDPRVEVVIVTGEQDRACEILPPARALCPSASDRVAGIARYARALAGTVASREEHVDDPELLRRALDQFQDVIMITDADAAILYVNEAFERLTGFTREEAVGRSPSILKSGKHDRAFYRDMRRTLANGESWSGRIVNRRRDGTLFEEQATITPVVDASNELVRYVAVKRDVTRDHAREEQQRQKQRMEVLGTLAGGICHEFNNLLTVIGGYANLIEESLDESDRLSGFAREVRTTTERAAGLTRQLLAFSRRQVIRAEILDLSSVLEVLEPSLRRILGERIQLEVERQDAVGLVSADRTLMEQVVMNLAVNARDAMPDGGRIRLRIAPTEASTDPFDSRSGGPAVPHVSLSVSDDGCGMAESTLSHIFEPFFTTKPMGMGTGLGLATVYGIVKQSGGYIRVTSEPGRGSRFEVALPVTEAEPASAPGRPPAEGAPGGGGETILLVEDEDPVRRLAETVLTRAGYRVLTARDGLDALAVARAHESPIELLLTDMVMPGCGGPELAGALRQERPETRVLFMSGYPEGMGGPEGADPGPRIEKPFGAAALVRQVRQILGA